MRAFSSLMIGLVAAQAAVPAAAQAPGASVVADGSFETGTPNASWSEASATSGSPICAAGACGADVAPRTGSFFVLFGGADSAPETASVEQVVTVPTGTAELSFWLRIPALPPTSLFETFLVTRNGAGPLAPPEYAALASAPADFPNVPGLTVNPLFPTEGQQVGPAEWLVHQGFSPQDATYGAFAALVTRDGTNFVRMREHDYEWRFSGTSLAYRAFTGGGFLTVPFELWDVGTTPDDAADDVRLIPWTNPGLTPDVFDLGRIDHAVSAGPNDPFTDWVYWYRPADESPGQAGYAAYAAAAEAGTYTGDDDSELFARMTLVNLNGGSVSTGTYVQALPDPGTVFRVVTRRLSATAAMTVSVDGVALATYTYLDHPAFGEYRFVALPADAFADGGAHRVRFEVAAAAGSPVRMAVDDVALRTWPAGTHLSVTPGAVAFGDVQVGTTAARAVTVLNDGTTPVDLGSVSYAGDGAVTASPVGPATLLPGDSREVTLTFAPNEPTAVSGTLTVTANAPGSPVSVAVSGAGTGAAVQLFCSSELGNVIYIPAGQPGPTEGVAGPYPGTITVSGVTQPVTDVDVDLSIYHTSHPDLDLLLQHPTGPAVVLVSDVGAPGAGGDLNVSLSDEAAGSLPASPVPSGFYRPTDLGSVADGYPAPAPAPTASSLAAFDGLSPNGVWALYAVDDAAGNVGDIGRWCISLTLRSDVAGEPGAVEGRHSLTAAPNPSRGASRVRLTVADGQDVDVVVYDVTGRLVRSLFSGPVAAGQTLELALDGRSLPAGVYVVRATGPTVSLARRVTVVR